MTHLRYSVIHGRARFALDDVERINQICIAQKSDQALDLLNFALYLALETTLDIATAILTISDVMPVSTSLLALNRIMLSIDDYHLATPLYELYKQISEKHLYLVLNIHSLKLRV